MPDCIACGFETVLPENIEAIEIIDIYINFMIDGMGSPDFLSIKKILTEEGYGNDKEMLQKIMLYCVSALMERNRVNEPIRKISSKSKDVIRASK